MTTALPVASLVRALDLAGTFAFALSGAVVGIRRRMDLFGVIVLAFLTAVAGGIVRDVLIGSVPPDALESWHNVALAAFAGTLAFCFGQPLARLNGLVQHVDAVGLAVFAVAGADKALSYGLTPVPAAVLGMVTAIGGGILRDVTAARIPTVLTSEIYAVAALLGAGVVAAGPALHLPPDAATLAGAVLCLALRVIAMHRGWKLPIALATPAETARPE